MESLDQQLSKLDLRTGRSISPRIRAAGGGGGGGGGPVVSGSKVAALASNFQQTSIVCAAKSYHGGGVANTSVSPKKVGPIVPPKPQKQVKLPEVPQSMVVKQVCEPLYSKRLQNNGARNDSNNDVVIYDGGVLASRPPVLHRKQPTYVTQNSLYNKMNKVTLDNPAVLEQQLEALAHHKMQLEKKGLLQRQQQKSPTTLNSSNAIHSNVPKLSTSSFLSDLKHSNNNNNSSSSSSSDLKSHNLEPYNNLYSNLIANANANANMNAINDSGTDMKSVNVYSNIASSQQDVVVKSAGAADMNRSASGSVYHSILYENDDFLPPPPPPQAVLTIATADSTEYLKNSTDDEIPPPPSPVSSSYSELRRATDIFSKIPIPGQQSFHDANIRSPVGGAVSGGNGNGSGNGGNGNGNGNGSGSGGGGGGGQQTYMNMNMNMNMNYNSDYVCFNESPQSMSQGTSDFYGYGSFSQGSSTYESIYEPINPRPPSQLSGRGNYLLYGQYANGLASAECLAGDSHSHSHSHNHSHSLNSSGANFSTLANVANNVVMDANNASGGTVGPSGEMKHLHGPKETEVEALTDFLVHSMDAAIDVDSYGICVKCNERVVGENSGCTAMDKIYHIACFTCSQCQINLQGKPFYALEGKPYCEYDYLQTLEKCSVCMKPILERILRATGKPYHPQCFTCVVCGNSLDGIPFTVDATNQNYCIADFHKKFAPRCCVCKQPIMPEPGQEETVRVVALDRSFHFECYKCEDCGLLLSSEAEGRGCYPLDDHVLCKSCNAKRVQMLTNRMTTEL